MILSPGGWCQLIRLGRREQERRVQRLESQRLELFDAARHVDQQRLDVAGESTCLSVPVELWNRREYLMTDKERDEAITDIHPKPGRGA